MNPAFYRKLFINFSEGRSCHIQISRETRILNILCVGLVLLAGVIRLAVKQIGYFSYNSMIFALFAAAASIWILQLQKRLLQPGVRHKLIGAALLMIFWMAVRTVKYDFLSDGHFAARYIWYLYYGPMLFIPLLMFLSVLAIGKPYDKNIDRRWYLLFIPTTAIFVGILTNDLHQKAFFFPAGLAYWSDYNEIRGFVYYTAMIWISLLFLAMLVVVFVRCAVSEKRKRIWVPFLPLLVGAGYTVCILCNVRNLLTRMLPAPEMGCLIFAAFMECLICVRLFPNNDNYRAFWEASSIGAGIMDKDGVVRYQSARSIPVTPEQVQRARNEDVFLENGRLLLKSHTVHGGFGYWIRDISEIRRLNEELKELGNITEEENSMLEAENKMRSERLRIEEQNRLYDDMARRVQKQLDRLNEILDSPPVEEEEFEKTMRYACILNAYIKRYSNLVLLSHQGSVMHSEELRHAVVESLEYVQLCGIKAQCFFDGKENLSGHVVMLAYEILEAVLEASVHSADHILVYLNVSESSLILRMELNVAEAIFFDGSMGKKTAELGGTLEIEKEDATEYLTLTLPAGGESI